MKLSRAFARVVRDLIQRAGISVRGLSRRSGVPERTLQNIVHEHQAVNLDQAKHIGNALDMTTPEIVEKAEEELQAGD